MASNGFFIVTVCIAVIALIIIASKLFNGNATFVRERIKKGHPSSEDLMQNKTVDLSEKKVWKKFNVWFWSLSVIGGLLTLLSSFAAASFVAGSIGSLLGNLFQWIAVVVALLILPIVVGYYAYKLGNSLWFLMVGIFGVGGFLNFFTFLIGYFIVLTLFKKKTQRWPILVALIALGIVFANLHARSTGVN